MSTSLYGRMLGKKVAEVFHPDRGWSAAPKTSIITVAALQGWRARGYTKIAVVVKGSGPNADLADFEVKELLTVARSEQRQEKVEQ